LTATLTHSWQIALRSLRVMWRQPAFIGISLSQPIIWLLLFGALFKRVVEIPGFHGHSYLVFLTPGVLVMNALFSSGWSGMGFIEDIERGVMDRFLVSPVRRSALIIGSIGYQAISTVIQALIMIGLALAVGARFGGGVAGVALAIGVAVLLTVAFASLSNGLGLLARQRETLIGMVQFIVLPASFLSSAFLQLNLTPRWIQHIARYNPVNWTADAARAALAANPDWGLLGWRVGLLTVFAIVCAWLGTRAFRIYQRSV
jgi:ABC-2 type transport system permease protein